MDFLKCWLHGNLSHSIIYHIGTEQLVLFSFVEEGQNLSRFKLNNSEVLLIILEQAGYLGFH